ncbi:hypothetical protein [Kitasatospora sp. NPDC017646]|uniref:hypothetical protein n=1 Tax=Kitasatospora sp. NPDC017646 TaxID=3364024 RepID=UPI0037A81754
MGIAVVGVVLNATPDWSRGASVSFVLVGVAYLLGAVCAWRLVARSERRTEAVAAAAPART